MDITHFKPGSELTFKDVVSVRSRLFRALMDDVNDSFCLDLSDVTQCDSAGLALLIEARKLCQHSHKRFDVIGITPQTRALATFCGVENFLEVNL